MIKDICVTKDQNCASYEEVERRCVKKGFSQADFFETLRKYNDLNVIYVSDTDKTITLI